MKGVFFLLGLFFLATSSFAQDAKVTLKASKTEVAVGEQFSIILSADVNGNGDISLPREFQVLSRMSGSSSRFINGQQSFEVTRTFVVIATKPGDYTIPPAVWTYGNNSNKSNSLKIKVVEGNGPVPQQQPQQYCDPFGSLFGPPRQPQQQSQREEKHFGMIITSKKEVYVGEPVLISGKVFFDGHIVDIADFVSYKMNLMAHKTDLRSDKANLSVNREEYGGKTYQTINLFEDLIIPQQPGEFTLSPFSIKIGYQRGFFDQGFKLVKSNEASITILPLPKGAPEGFDGAVGNYKVKVEYDIQPQMQAGDIIGIRVTIDGSGNINLLKALELALPEGISLYGDPKVENKIKINRKGASGSIYYEFVAQITQGGKYNFKPFAFAFFNPESKRYEKIDIPALQFEATGELKSEKEIKEIAQAKEEEKNASQIWKTISFVLLGLLLLIGLIYFLRKNSDIFKFKPRKRKVNASARALRALESLNASDNQNPDHVERIIIQFFKDLTQDDSLLISDTWFDSLPSEISDSWRQHFSTVQAMKYAGFGHMSNRELIDKTIELVRSTKI
jgi:hypothetical protein